MSAIRKIRINETLAASVDEMLEARGMNFSEMGRRLFEEEIARWKRESLQLTPKKIATGTGVTGRPMLSAQEKTFREQVRDIDEIYLGLQNDYAKDPGVFERLFGRQFALWKEAVDVKNYQDVNWWTEFQPWRFKIEAQFEKLYRSRNEVSESVGEEELIAE